MKLGGGETKKTRAEEGIYVRETNWVLSVSVDTSLRAYFYPRREARQRERREGRGPVIGACISEDITLIWLFLFSFHLVFLAAETPVLGF